MDSFISFYNLTGSPFGKSIKREHMFRSAGFKEFSSRVEYLKQHRGLMLLTGESGVGKTTAIRSFVEELKPEFFKSVYLPLATVSSYEFYIQLNEALGGEYLFRKASLFSSIQNIILEYATIKKQIPVIIFDEMHLLRSQNFFELQMVLNFHYDSLDPAIVLLCGHSHLKDTLLRPVFSPINQRMRIKYEFSPLGLEETKEYIVHHLKLVGGTSKLFTDGAIEGIHNISSGIMRIINNIGTKALIGGALARKEVIDEELIYGVHTEL